VVPFLFIVTLIVADQQEPMAFLFAEPLIHNRAERQIRHLTITNYFTGASCNQSEMSFLRDLCVLVAKKTSGLVFFARQI
jgi:hypothetical protein